MEILTIHFREPSEYTDTRGGAASWQSASWRGLADESFPAYNKSQRNRVEESVTTWHCMILPVN
jgi:hypothetical protein